MNNSVKPFLKWAGGKRQLISKVKEKIDSFGLEDYRLVEPFVGGGIVFLSIQNKRVWINDLNSELVNCYEVVRDNQDDLLRELKKMQDTYKDASDQGKYFYEIRAKDREPGFGTSNEIERAARTIFLNKTCFNGIYRVNSNGYFNVPWCKQYRNVYEKQSLEETSKYLKNNKVKITNSDYLDVLKKCREGDIVYIDPPYDYEDESGNEKSGFVSYQKEGFTRDNLRQLKDACDKCIERGAKVIVSNNATTFVKELFKGEYYTFFEVEALRSLNCKGNGRRSGREVIITGEKK